MKGKLKILMVFSEVAPFTSIEGVGEVGGALPKALKDLGHDVRVIAPQYRAINERKYVLRDVIRLQQIEIPLGEKSVTIDVKSAFLPNSKVQVYFIDYKPFFFREGLYKDAKTGKTYTDNDLRFVLFSKGVLKTLIKLQWQPDVLHCHGWQAGLIPYLLKTTYKDDAFFQKTFSQFTIHDIQEQGQFSSKCYSYISDDATPFPVDPNIESHGKCNFLKAGIYASDLVNTVRENHLDNFVAQGIEKTRWEEVFSWRSGSIYGVNNGIDECRWNPETDKSIASNYSVSDLKPKEDNRAALIEKCELNIPLETPIVTVFTELVDDEGLDLIIESMDKLIKLPVSVVFFGKMTKARQSAIKKFRKSKSGYVAIQPDEKEIDEHLVTAGSDIMLMPVNHAALDASHLFCMNYGVVPMVFIPDGKKSNIKQFDASTGKGNGFVFNRFASRQMVKSVEKAIKLFQDIRSWQKLMKSCMREDLTWANASKKYVQLYGKCVTRNKK